MLKAISQSTQLLKIAVFLSSTLLSHVALSEDTPSESEDKKSLKPNTMVVLETNRGDITLELFDNKTPKTVANFINYVKSGFYSNTVFHRVIPGFVIQGGGFTKELAKKKNQAAIRNEASADLKNDRGTIAMARLSAPHTATSQFFINLNDNRSLNYQEYNPGYAVFGRVSDGMNIVDIISKSKTSNIGMQKNVPLDAIIIKHAYVISNNQVTTNNTADQQSEEQPVQSQ